MRTTKLEVFHNDRHVGTIAETPNGLDAFSYDAEWLRNGFSLSPLSLPLKPGVFLPKNRNFDGLFGVFADSLPDSWGRLVLRRKLRGLLYKHERSPLFFLSLSTTSSMGSLTYKPKLASFSEQDIKDIDKIEAECQKILSGEEVSDIETLFSLAGSSGGSRPKIHCKVDGIDCIIKFRSSEDSRNMGEMEEEYAQAARRMGIDMPRSFLLKGKSGRKYFGIERFDRLNNGRKRHMVSAAALLEVQMDEVVFSYEGLFQLTWIITHDKKDLGELFRRMVFNVYAHNEDDHLKNFSYLYDEEKEKYVLSSAYDLTYSTTAYGGHNLSVNGKTEDIDDIDLLSVGRKAGLSDSFMENVTSVIKMEATKIAQKYRN